MTSEPLLDQHSHEPRQPEEDSFFLRSWLLAHFSRKEMLVSVADAPEQKGSYINIFVLC